MDHDIYPLQFGRGINLASAPEAMGDGQCRVLENFRTLGDGRITTRKAALRFGMLGGQKPLAIEAYTGLPGVAGVALTWEEPGESDVAGKVNLWTTDGYGNCELIGSLAGWEDVYENLRVHMAVVNSIVFICDEDRAFGLTIWDPNFFLGGEDESGPAAFFQPTFVFSQVVFESGESLIGESGESAFFAEPMYPNVVVEHENHLWAFGFGDETDPDRPEYAHFSYLGLVADAQGSGDAGLAGVVGSTNLFDVEDVVPITPRGERVVGAASAPGRMLVCSDNVPYAIYGQDRETWRKDKLDSQRGLLNSLAIGEGNGAIWWASPLGWSKWSGGGTVDDMSDSPDGGSIRALLPEIDQESILFGHAFHEGQVRFYYKRRDDVVEGCNLWSGWDYRAKTFLGDKHTFTDGSRIVCVGSIRPQGNEKPASQPLGVVFERVGAHVATVIWAPGDPMPGVRTTVKLIGPDGSRIVGKVEGGASRYVLTGLTPSTDYSVDIEEVRNGSSLGPLRGEFTTLAETAVLPVESLAARQSSYLSTGAKGQAQLLPMLDLTWTLGETEVTVILERALTVDGDFSEIAELTGTIYHDKDVVADSTYYYRAKARDLGGNESAYSDTAVQQAATVPPIQGVGSGLPGEGASQGFDEDDQ